MSIKRLQTSKDENRFSAFGQTHFGARRKVFQRALKYFTAAAEFLLPRQKLPVSPCPSPLFPGSFSQTPISSIKKWS